MQDGTKKMPKAYVIARVNVHDAEAYARYAALAPVAMKQYGARVLARGGRCEALEGEARARNVVLEFNDYETAKAYFHSPEYQEARGHRLGAADFDLTLVEGV
jgi:uncharacterized protein (DUF1330 family)